MADVTNEPVDEEVPEEVPEAVQRATNSGDLGRARALLDEWEARQRPSLGTLSALRFWRKHLGQAAEAVRAAERMVEMRPADSRERAADLCRLGELRTRAGRPDEAWAALSEAASWPGLSDGRDAGLARSVVEVALELSESEGAGPSLSRRAFELAAALLQGGGASSLVILERARDRAEALGDGDRHAAFAAAARDLRRSLRARERGRPPARGA